MELRPRTGLPGGAVVAIYKIAEGMEMDRTPKKVREVMQAFVDERLEAKVAKLKPEQVEAGEGEALVAKYQLDTWLLDAARRVGQIQLATHTIKPMHPEAKGTSLHVADPQLDEPGLVGTHSLPETRANDVVGNAAALDVFKFLNLECEGKTLLSLVLAGDAIVKAALCDDPVIAQELCAAFAGITEGNGGATSHSLAKQLYFPVGEEGEYHLLAPLFPTTLVHHVHQTLREHRFGDTAKAAREARSKGKPSTDSLHEYVGMAIQKFGGTKPQNISQLNSERYGENWLLASLPPVWKSPEISPPLGTGSVFERRIGGRKRIRELVKSLKEFLRTTSHNNSAIRDRRARLVANICDEVLLFAAEVHSLDAGWTAVNECKLNESEKLWLDPHRAAGDVEFGADYRWRDWPMEVSDRFASWFNHVVSVKGSVLGDAEHGEWKMLLAREIGLFRDYLVVPND